MLPVYISRKRPERLFPNTRQIVVNKTLYLICETVLNVVMLKYYVVHYIYVH